MQVFELAQYIDKRFPEAAKQEDDNVGLLIGQNNDTISKVLVCLDVTNAVVDEAISGGYNMIVSHHPVIFTPQKNITGDTYTGLRLQKLIRNWINVYSSHTPMDIGEDGINDHIAKLLFKRGYRELYVGRVGDLKEPVNVSELMVKLGAIFSDNGLTAIGKNKTVRRAAIISGGCGTEYYVEMAKRAGADCFISGDFRHSALVYATDNDISLIDWSHYSCEQGYMKVFAKSLAKAFPSIAVDMSKEEKNPINFGG